VLTIKYPGGLRKNKGISAKAVIFLLTVVSLFSCDPSDEKISRSTDADYFPLKTGWYQIYNVEETTYQLGIPTTLSYQLKTIVSDSFENGGGNFTYVIHRTRRDSENEAWIPEATWSARLTAREAIVTEGGTAFVVLQFPVAEGVSWNGNLYNNEVNPNTNSTEDTYSIVSKDGSCLINNVEFNNCVEVERENNEEFIVFHDERREIYGRNVGLLFSERIQLQYCNDEDLNCVGQQIIDQGIIYKQEIVEYGVE
jgi:hypothetical protein